MMFTVGEVREVREFQGISGCGVRRILTTGGERGMIISKVGERFLTR